MFAFAERSPCSEAVELDGTVLDGVYLAGKRFELIIRQLAQA